MTRVLLIIVLFFLSSSFIVPFSEEPVAKDSSVFFSSDSYLKIKGKTNISTFECNFNMNTLSDSIKVNYKDLDRIIKFNKATLILPNVQFNCGGKAINNDFKKLLNTDEFPEIIIKLKQISKVGIDKNSITATVEIMICNIVNTYTIPISIIKEDRIFVRGTLPLDINDFSLAAPTKILGMVKVSSLIEIQFSLNILSC